MNALLEGKINKFELLCNLIPRADTFVDEIQN